MTEKAKAPTAPASAPVDPGADEQTLADGIEGIRAGLRKAGGVLGTGATAILGGLGYARLHDLFPAPVGEEWLYGTAAAAAALAIAGAAVLAGRFFAGQRRVLLSAEIPATDDKDARKKRGFSEDELKLVREVLDDHAHDESARDLHALELRALRLERIGRQKNTEPGKRLSAEVERLNDVVRIALKRAAATVIEHRAHDAVNGRATKYAFAAAATGIALLWGVADYSKGQRDLIDLRKKCADAIKVGATTACEPVVPNTQLKADTAAKKKETGAKAAAKKTAAAKREAGLLALEARMPSGAVKSITTSKQCAELVTGRLGSQPEAMRIKAVQACVSAAAKGP